MAAAVPRLLVVGGNGYLGSAVCKAAVSKGWDVSSMSSSGKPYTSPAGHSPKWASRVTWHKADAFDPATYAPLVGASTAVVHTLGILLEGGYKASVASGDVLGLVRAMVRNSTGSGEVSNPLKTGAEKARGYDAMNRDSALTVLDTMLTTPSPPPPPRSFVFVSAAHSFRPVVPARYLASKREAEASILSRCAGSQVDPIIVRPGLMYHPHVRPVSTLPAFALSLTAGLHDRVRLPFGFGPPESLLGGMAEALRTHPMHVDHVADAIVRAIAEQQQGVIDVQTMRRWAGFDVPEEPTTSGAVH
ncbi:hypothetical protein VHUM_03117 [Vanrija humicola]|uniref:NAD-dependent epimerase/dehydratase domain-containing protein n=1 Tax=Vanrija humicola TaxID=5417 RepID=A0A7D8V0H1_VANHU|nr:hypothetical protein VHUM_03117 [Vanrija humicola]